MVKIQTLTTTALCALIILGGIGFITGNGFLQVITPALVIGTMLLVGVILNITGKMVFPPSES